MKIFYKQTKTNGLFAIAKLKKTGCLIYGKQSLKNDKEIAKIYLEEAIREKGINKNDLL